MDRILTKKAMLLSSVRLHRQDAETIVRAAAIEGLSRSEFLRRSGIERAKRVIRKSQTERRLTT